MIVCKICGKECSDRGIGTHVKNQHCMRNQDYYDKYYEKHVCPVCGKETVFRSINQGYLTYCSIKCADLEKSVFIRNNPQKNDEIKAKTKQTVQNRYGVNNPFQIAEIKEKCIANNHTEKALRKRSASLYRNIQEFCKANDCIPMEEAIKLNPCVGWWSEVTFILYKKWRKCIPVKYIDIIKNYTPNTGSSKNERKLFQIISENYDGTIKPKDRTTIAPYELDIYLPELKLAIEYNGIYYHSTEMGTSKDYHLRKSLMCRDKGIRLIHIYDIENFDEQCQLLLQLINGNDLYNKLDFNKNNLLENIPKPILIYNDGRLHVYGAGKLYEI